jgi:hypothetical protein
MTAATTITDAELVQTLSLITAKMDSVRHRIAADGQLTVSEAAELAVAIELTLTSSPTGWALPVPGAAVRGHMLA